MIGPLLFLVYCNDLPNCLSDSACIQFADDTTTYLKGNNIQTLQNKMNENLSCVLKWCNCNSLKLNAAKTNYMVFNERRNTATNLGLNLGGATIERVKKFKMLGIWIDDNLKWQTHVDFVSHKVSQGLFAMRRAKNYSTKRTLLNIYHALIQSHLQYGVSIWGKAAQCRMKKLEVIQKKAIRIAHNAPYNSHTPPLFREARTFRIKELYDFNASLIMYQLHYHTLPSSIMACFTRYAHSHSHHLRTTHDYIAPLPTKDAIKKSILFLGQNTWSEIPALLKTYSMKKFKSHLKNHLLSRILVN